MLLGFISDLHANLQALEAVLDDARDQGPDALICLGDFVGYGGQPNEVVRLARDQTDVALIGNHDLAALGVIDPAGFNVNAQMAVEWTATHLTKESMDALSGLRSRREAFGLLLAHASPRDPVFEYVLDPRVAAENFAAEQFEVAIVGHTHIPAAYLLEGQFVTRNAVDRWVQLNGSRAVLNPGSVGQPRDGDPRASWGIFDSESSRFMVRRVGYDVAAAQRAIRDAGLPHALADRLGEGR